MLACTDLLLGASYRGSQLVVAQRSANVCLNKVSSTSVVLSAIDPNRINCESAAVAHTTSYCCRPRLESVVVASTAASSGWLLSLAQIALRCSITAASPELDGAKI